MWQSGRGRSLNEKGDTEIEERHHIFRRPRKGFVDGEYI